MRGCDSNWFFGIVLSCISICAQTANHPVISEIRYDERSGLNEEFVELYNPTADTVFLSGWSIRYKSMSGSTWRSKVVFTDTHRIQPGGFFLWGGEDVMPLPDAAESSQRSVGLSNSGGTVALLDPAEAEADRVAWKGGDMPEGTADAGSTEDGGSLERKASPASTAESLQSGGHEAHAGNGYDSDDNGADFVVQPPDAVCPQNTGSAREPASGESPGSGGARIDPRWVFADTQADIRLILSGDTSRIIRTIRILPPWSLDRDIDRITISVERFPGGEAEFRGDTLLISDVAVAGADSIVIGFLQSPVPAEPGAYPWAVFTGSGDAGSPCPALSEFPVLDVEPAVTDIALLHYNDMNGIPVDLGLRISVSGIVTAASGVFSPVCNEAWLQDPSGGIRLFSHGGPMMSLTEGDSMAVTGTLDQFRGMTEIVPDPGRLVVLSRHRPLPAPCDRNCRDLNNAFQPDGTEPDEGRLIRIRNVDFDADSGLLSDSTGSCRIDLDPDTDIVMPLGRMHVTGYLVQVKPGEQDPGPPYTGDYCLRPRTSEDFEPLSALQFLQVPAVSDWEDTGVTLCFETSDSCRSRVAAWKQPGDSMIIQGSMNTRHCIGLTGLDPASVYLYRVYCENGESRIGSAEAVFVTRSPGESTGIIEAYFNGTVSPEEAEIRPATGSEDLHGRLTERIQAASSSIDACFMKLTDRDIGNALIGARERGVSVRFICEQDEVSEQAVKDLIAAGIPVMTDADSEPENTGIMHHKFAVFDHRDRAIWTDDWVWTGSFNPTDYGSYSEPLENVILVQDPALAAVFTCGFEQLWGSRTDVPDPEQSVFGNGRRVIVPGRVMVGETLAEIFWSPEGSACRGIEKALLSADHHVDFCMFSFTQDRLAGSLIGKSVSGQVRIRGLIDGPQIHADGEYSQWPALREAFPGLVRCYSGTVCLHHKYAVIDACTDSDPIVITGSYNWTRSAEDRNHENVLIIHDAELADQYTQEFVSRYHEAGTGLHEQSLPGRWELHRNGPNPFNGETRFGFRIPEQARICIQVLNVCGQHVCLLTDRAYDPGSYCLGWDGVDTSGRKVSSGIYVVRFSSPVFQDQMKIMLIQ
ncbi:lamin tail domain-containing protein [bacterium]|nr:lamin tail domain-containing protein [bacterium]